MNFKPMMFTLYLSKNFSQISTTNWLQERWYRLQKRRKYHNTIMNTAQNKKFFITDFFSKCDEIRKKLRIWSHILKISVMKTSFFVQWNIWQFTYNSETKIHKWTVSIVNSSVCLSNRFWSIFPANFEKKSYNIVFFVKNFTLHISATSEEIVLFKKWDD